MPRACPLRATKARLGSNRRTSGRAFHTATLNETSTGPSIPLRPVVPARPRRARIDPRLSAASATTRASHRRTARTGEACESCRCRRPGRRRGSTCRSPSRFVPGGRAARGSCASGVTPGPRSMRAETARCFRGARGRASSLRARRARDRAHGTSRTPRAGRRSRP
jgi:hypothetical protein